MVIETLNGIGKRVRIDLKVVRALLAEMDRRELDAELIRLQNEGAIVLYHNDVPFMMNDSDHEAALMVGGNPRHLVYVI